MTVLIVSSLADPHARAVIAELGKLGAQAELLDLADFPTKLTLTLAFGCGEHRFRLRRPGESELDLDTVRAVWWRRPRAFVLPETLRNPAYRQLALSESSTAFHGLFAAMDALWINPPSCDAVAGHKPFQLALAQSLGLEIPQTMMTSDPEEAREFWRAWKGDVIYKQFIALPEAWSETRRLGEAETKVPDAAIRLAPVIFQRHVAAVADLRVTIIGDDVFAAAVDVRDLTYDVDVRLNLDAKHVAHDLPDDVAEMLRAFMRRLGLVYGAIDLRLTEDGRYVFLEINPAGQFLYVEEQTGQPITAALAARLAAGR
jgi:glutathione synthase/RimK-type ligase-like ATP-grasp enzyme